MNISPAIDLALLYNPHMAYRDVHTVNLWLNEGADMDKDVLPTMKLLMAKNPRISTFSYFTNAIMVEAAKRKAAEPVEKPIDPDADHKKAKRMAWVRDRCSSVRISSSDAAWLKEYEAVHGIVTA